MAYELRVGSYGLPEAETETLNPHFSLTPKFLHGLGQLLGALNIYGIPLPGEERSVAVGAVALVN